MQVPTCSKLEEERLELEEWERRSLVKRMVEEGIQGGLRSSIREASKRDGGIAQAIKRMRRSIGGQVERAQVEAQERYDEDVRALRKRWKYESDGRSKDMDALEKRSRSLDDAKGIGLDSYIMGDELVSIVVEGPELSAWQRFVAWLKRQWYRLIWAMKRFWRWLSGRKKVKARKGKRGPRLLLRGIGYESKFGKALFSSPSLKREMDDRIRIRDEEEGRPSSFSNQGTYVDAAMEAFNQYIREKRHEAKKKVKGRSKEMERRLKRLREEERQAEEELERRLEELSKERAREIAEQEDKATEGPRQKLQKEVMDFFKRIGYIKDGPDGPAITSRMIDRFAEFVYHSEMESLPSRLQARTGQAESKHGAYERTRMKTVHEISKMDLVESLVRSRISHPGHRHIEDEDIIVNREVSSERSHIVLMFDKSSSMEENNRILAAKKAVLALFKAAKRANPRNVVDIATFDTRVNLTDLDELWASNPSGFTNTGEAIRVARNIIGPSRADKKMIYLITDGLPEAFTTKEGKARAGDRRTSLEYALQEAAQLSRLRDQRLVVLLLEPEDDRYVDAATQIAKKAVGSLIVTDPKHLAGEMLVDYATA